MATPNIKANLNFSIFRTHVIGPKIKSIPIAIKYLFEISKVLSMLSITKAS